MDEWRVGLAEAMLAGTQRKCLSCNKPMAPTSMATWRATRKKCKVGQNQHEDRIVVEFTCASCAR